MSRLAASRCFMRFLSPICCCVTLLLATVTANGQRAEPPRLALDFKGPVGRTRAVGFLNDGRRFHAAGESKLVQFYDIADARIVPGTAVRWEFARGSLGEINATAATADGRRLLIGGSSARGPGGDIVLVDPGNQQVLEVLSAGAEVVSLVTNADASVIAASNRLGGIVAWTLAGGQRIRRELHPTAPDVSGDDAATALRRSFHPLALATDRWLLAFVILDTDSGPQDQLTAFDLTGTEPPRPLGLFSQTGSAITTASAGGLLIAGDADGNLSIRRSGLEGAVQTASLNQLLQVPTDVLLTLRNLVLSPDAAHLAVLGDLESTANVRSFLILLDANSLAVRDRVEFPGREACRAAAFSEDSTRILTHNDDREQLLIWELRTPAGELQPQPLQAAPMTATGRGRIFRQARFAADMSTQETGYQLVLKDSSEKIAVITSGDSDLEESDAEPPNSPPPAANAPDTFAPGWTVTADSPTADGLTQTLSINPPRGSPFTPVTIALSIPDQGFYSGAHAFLKGTDGVPAAVAIGTRTVDGIFVYRLPSAASQAPQLVRYFRDHSSAISDLSVSTDQRYLVSCAGDKTVRIWSLEGLNLPRQQAVFGARFERSARGAVVLRDLLKAGILFARGLRDGDSLTHLAGFATADEVITEAARIESILQQHPAWEIVDLWSSRTGFSADSPGDTVLRINPGWEPLLTLVSDKAGEWVLFTPEGYFDASIAEGDRLFGWQINQGVDQAPRFEPAEHLQKEYEKPEVIRQVLQLGNVPDALAALNRPVAADLRQELQRRVLALPQIEILTPADGAELPAGQPVTIQARVTFVNPADAAAFEIQASHNGRLLPAPVIAGPAATRQYTWQSQQPEAANTITVSARQPGEELTNSDQGRDTAAFFTTGRPRDPAARVYLLAFAVDQYIKSAPLQYSVGSVQGFRDDLEAARGLARPYGALSQVVADTRVNWTSVTGTLAEFITARKAQASPDDLVIVVVCGRGISRAVSVGGSVRTGVGEEFFFLPPDVDPRNLRQLDKEGVRWKDLCRPVNNLECDVLWIIDAAHSARARNEARSAFAECRSPHGRHVLFADRSDAVEAASLQVHRADRGNTAMMLAVREALVGSDVSGEVQAAVAALWNDRTLTFEDLSSYASDRATQAAKSLGKSQKVIASPSAPASHLRPLILGNGDFGVR
ncbi:MAG: WD40 repeat domain-containing protein [Planctomycetaceae bacterium]